jgi:hypothetical protein
MRYSAWMLWLKYINRDPRIAIVVAALIFGAMFSIPCAIALTNRLPFLLDGETAQATVVSKQIAESTDAIRTVAAIRVLAHGGKRGPKNLINYQFTDAAGIAHTGRSAIPIAEWNDLQLGDRVLIRYVRSHPEQNELEREVWDFWPIIPFAVLGLAALIGAIYFGLRGLRWIAGQVRLVRTGEAVAGRFANVEVQFRGRRKRDVICILDYESAAPPAIRGTIKLRGKPRPNWRTGGNLVILVDPDDPAKHCPDIFEARIDDWERLQLGVGKVDG